MISDGNYRVRSKFNTLTPAEARKINTFLAPRRAPSRTASVLNKPRPPPIVTTTNLDNLDTRSVDVTTTHRPPPPLYGESGGEYITRQLSNLSHNSNRSSASRTSLSSSTYKVFQSPFAIFKRLITSSNIVDSNHNSNNKTSQSTDNKDNDFFKIPFDNESIKSSSGQRHALAVCDDNRPRSYHPNLNNSNLVTGANQQSDDLDGSGDGSFMERSSNYSNYDDFTRSRNERFSGRSLKPPMSFDDYSVNSDIVIRSCQVPAQKQQLHIHRNRQVLPGLQSAAPKLYNNNTMNNNNASGSALTSRASGSSSCQSLASITTTDSILDYQRNQQQQHQPSHQQEQQQQLQSLQLPAKSQTPLEVPSPPIIPAPPTTPAAIPYRFSFAQPLAPPAPLNVSVVMF